MVALFERAYIHINYKQCFQQHRTKTQDPKSKKFATPPKPSAISHYFHQDIVNIHSLNKELLSLKSPEMSGEGRPPNISQLQGVTKTTDLSKCNVCPKSKARSRTYRLTWAGILVVPLLIGERGSA
jgi:hypothetical protein